MGWGPATGGEAERPGWRSGEEEGESLAPPRPRDPGPGPGGWPQPQGGAMAPSGAMAGARLACHVRECVSTQHYVFVQNLTPFSNPLLRRKIL